MSARFREKKVTKKQSHKAPADQERNDSHKEGKPSLIFWGGEEGFFRVWGEK